MTSDRQVRRGQFWLVALGAARAGELGKTRPAVVVSSDLFDVRESNDLVTVVPLSTARQPGPDRPAVAVTSGLERDSVAVCRSVTSVARARLVKYLGELPGEVMADVSVALARCLDLDLLG